MKYYKLNVYRRQDKDFSFIERPPEEIALLSSYIMSGKKAASKYPEDVVAKMSDRGGLVLSDFIGNAELSIIAHESVKNTIESVCGDACEYLPVSIENHKGRIASDEYFYINPLGTYDCLNKELSDIDYTDDGKVIGVDEFVFDLEKLQDVPDLFRVPEDHSVYFISEKLVETIKQAKPDVTNLNLQEKEVK
ncbi:imm11 family protein [Teredinibacter sp. KSP-S5-2]|uniref:imm11 family protein n=1 Tax=Teredinibacter sp. KSP-S5-2 TaxID=3034506 RepID=UPI0029349CBA|nr:DUF1629 domain-containing protein [Teredinibacter sp. KSP-S5-2]WNO10393.1 hypothetical protein P5V12_04340 [Teredinibacter sp. KSP-S5-2]